MNTNQPGQPRLVDRLSALAVDEVQVPVDLAARAVAAARATPREAPGFLDELVVMARRGVVLGAACASLLLVLAIGQTTTTTARVTTTTAQMTTTMTENPLVAWWETSLSAPSTTAVWP